jgi:hypothetical protein
LSAGRYGIHIANNRDWGIGQESGNTTVTCDGTLARCEQATRRNIPEDAILHSPRHENLKSHIALTGWAQQRRRNVSPVRYGLGFYIPEDDILHSHCRENLKYYIALTGWALQRRRNVSPVRYGLSFYIPEDAIPHSHRRENLKSYIALTGWAL